jgi:hypothetical protein
VSTPPSLSGSGRTVDSSIRALSTALGDFRRAITAGDLEDLLIRTGALEEAAAQLSGVAGQQADEDTGPGGRTRRDGAVKHWAIASMDRSLAPADGSAGDPWSELKALREEAAVTRTFLLRALELTRQRQWHVQRVLGTEGAYTVSRLPTRFTGYTR